MTTITSPTTAHDVLTSVQSTEQEVLSKCHPRLAGPYGAITGQHHGYLRTAQILEADALSAADTFSRLAASNDREDLERSYTHSRAQEYWALAARFGEAWVLYESMMTRPAEEIVLAMCEAGFPDHARFIVTGEWQE